MQGGGYLLVGGGGRERRRVLEGAAELDQDLLLGRRDTRGRSEIAGDDRGVGLGVGGRAEEHGGLPEPSDIAVAKELPPTDPLLVDVRAVGREAVVDNGARVADELEVGVQLRDLIVEAQPHVCGGAASYPQRRVALLDDEDLLLALAVAVDEE